MVEAEPACALRDGDGMPSLVLRQFLPVRLALTKQPVRAERRSNAHLLRYLSVDLRIVDLFRAFLKAQFHLQHRPRPVQP